MIKVAFASSDGEQIDQHFGASQQLMIFEIQPGMADLLEIGHFEEAQMKGEHKDKVPGYVADENDTTVSLNDTTPEEEVPLLTEDKVIAKIDFVSECSAVYAASIGSSSIRRLMNAGIQPVIVDYGHEIMDLLNEVSFALVHGGLSWVDRAKAKTKPADRFETMAENSWQSSQNLKQLLTDLPD